MDVRRKDTLETMIIQTFDARKEPPEVYPRVLEDAEKAQLARLSSLRCLCHFFDGFGEEDKHIKVGIGQTVAAKKFHRSTFSRCRSVVFKP
jgi:hypothetical protein